MVPSCWVLRWQKRHHTLFCLFMGSNHIKRVLLSCQSSHPDASSPRIIALRLTFQNMNLRCGVRGHVHTTTDSTVSEDLSLTPIAVVGVNNQSYYIMFVCTSKYSALDIVIILSTLFITPSLILNVKKTFQ